MRFVEFYLKEDITDNPNFKKWFGNSKVVDKSGNPLVVYHGSGAIENIHSFFDDQFFTSNDYIAQSYAENMGGKVYEVYLKITNHLDFTIDGKLDREKIIQEVYGIDSIQYKNFERYSDGYGLGNALHGDFSKLIKYAKQHGHDGIKFTDSSFDNQILDTTYIVFKSNQIKSINNNGDFNPNSNNINEMNDYDASSMIRLYRGMQREFNPNHDLSDTDAPHGYSTWTDNIELAKQYAGKNGYVYQIDLPTKEMGEELIDNDGERSLFVNNKKPAGLNNISGDEYLVYTAHDLYNSNDIKLINGDNY